MDRKRLTRKLLLWSVSGIGLLLIISLLAGVGLHLFGSFRLAKTRAEFDERWGHLATPEPSPAVPDTENGARWLVTGGQAITCSLEDREFYGQLSERSAAGWSPEEFARTRRILEQERAALNLLLRTGDCAHFDFGVDGVQVVHDEVDFSAIVMGLRLLILDARLAWEEDRIDDGIAALNAAGRSIDGLLKSPIIMTWTIGSIASSWSLKAAAELVSDPCTPVPTLEALRSAIPSEDPIQSGNATLAILITEIADEGLDYIEAPFDPSMGWSVPFWVSNRFLLEDLIVSEILARWTRLLDLSQTPAADWPDNASHGVWGDGQWPLRLALTGSYTPNLLSIRARAQAISAEKQGFVVGLDLRLAQPAGLTPDACSFMGDQPPNALTGTPPRCRYDEDRHLVLIEIPGAAAALKDHFTADNRLARIPPIELPVGQRTEHCE